MIKHLGCLLVIKVFFQWFGGHVFVVADTFATIVSGTMAHVPNAHEYKGNEENQNQNYTSYNATRKTFALRFITWKWNENFQISLLMWVTIYLRMDD